jgi:hypothetical protein
MIINMPTKALNAAGGKAFVLQVSLPEADVALLDDLAALTGKSRSAVARQIVREALGLDDQAEGRDPP